MKYELFENMYTKRTSQARTLNHSYNLRYFLNIFIFDVISLPYS